MATKTITLTSNRDRASTTVRVTVTRGSKGYENMSLSAQALRNAETRAGLVNGDFFCLPSNLVVYDRHGTPVAC